MYVSNRTIDDNLTLLGCDAALLIHWVVHGLITHEDVGDMNLFKCWELFA